MKKTTLLLALTTLVCKLMKTIPQLQLIRALRLRGTFLPRPPASALLGQGCQQRQRLVIVLPVDEKVPVEREESRARGGFRQGHQAGSGVPFSLHRCPLPGIGPWTNIAALFQSNNLIVTLTDTNATNRARRPGRTAGAQNGQGAV